MSRCDLGFVCFSIHSKQRPWGLSLEVSYLSLTMSCFILLFFEYFLFSVPSILSFWDSSLFFFKCLVILGCPSVCIFSCLLAFPVCLSAYLFNVSASCGYRGEAGHATRLSGSVARLLGTGTPTFFWGTHTSWLLSCL